MNSALSSGAITASGHSHIPYAWPRERDIEQECAQPSWGSYSRRDGRKFGRGGGRPVDHPALVLRWTRHFRLCWGLPGVMNKS